MAPTLKGKTIAFLVAPEGIEQVELTEPWQAVLDAGGTPRLVSTESGTVQGYQHLDKADTFVLRRGQAGGGHLPRPVDAGRGRRCARPSDDVVAERQDRPP